MKRYLINTLALTLLLVVSRAPAVAQTDSTATSPASADLDQATMGSATQVDMSALPEMVPLQAAALSPPPRPRGGLSDLQYQAAKAAAANNRSGPSGETGPAPLSPPVGRQTPGASTVFRGQSEVPNTRPSDMGLAVSNSWVVQVVNSTIAVFNKSGVLQAGFPKSLGNFFPGSTGDVGDPRAFYDWNGNRFVVIADDFSGGRIWLAASATNNPTGTWHIYSFNVWGATANCRISGRICADFPTLGFDDSTIYLAVTVFPANGVISQISDFVLLLPKANIYAGAGFSFNFWFNLTFGGVRVDSVQPVTLLNQSEHPRAGFAINSFNINFGGVQCRTGCNGLVVWAFSNNLVASGSPGPELSAVRVATANYFLPADANQPGFPNSIDTGDVRISGTPIYHAGTFYASLNTNGSDAHSHTLWFQVRPFLNDNDARCTGSFVNRCPQVIAAQLLNQDCYFCGGQGAAGSTFYGTVAPDTGGDVTMAFGYSDNNIFPESAYVSRRVTQAANSMHDSGIVLCGGSGAYRQGRWGDYTAAVGDIASATQNFMWFSAMHVSNVPNFTFGGFNWSTCIAKNGFTAVNQP